MSGNNQRGASILGANRLKLGVFGSNVDGGLTITTMPERHSLNWQTVSKVACVADEAGFELQVPVARWRPIGGTSNFQGRNYETLAWAAGISAVTQRSNILATVHVPVIHPLVAAKQLTTIDHISSGRAGVNLVCGWFQAEFDMFGSPMLGHTARYEYAAEWLEIVRKLWSSEDEFDFEGQFFKVAKGFHQPKPLRRPPPVMNAGMSPTGMRFMAKYADIGFQSVDDDISFESTRTRFAEVRRIAREDYGRSLDLWSSAVVFSGATEREAQDYFDYCVHTHGDMSALVGVPDGLAPPSNLPPDILERKQRNLLAGWGGLVLIGTPDRIVDKLISYSSAGLDGLVLSWPNYLDGLTGWIRDVAPLLEQSGLRDARPGHG